MSPNDVEFFRSVLARDPGLTQVYADLAEALLIAGDCEGAAVEASAGIDRDPNLSKAWLVRATARKMQCDYSGAVRDFECAIALSPGRAAILVNLANCYAELGRFDEAEHALRRAVDVAPRSAVAQASLGSVLVRQGRMAEAVVPCRAALLLDPALVEAHQNLSGILAVTDPAAARYHRDAAYRRQQIFVERAARPERTVLVLSAADAGNVPLQHLMPRTRITLIRWYIEYASGDQEQSLPPYDLIFNAIGEADFLPVMPTAVAKILRAEEARVLNHPTKIALTGRADLPGLLSGIPNVVVPAVIRRDGSAESRDDALARAGISVPVLARPLGAHGGEGVLRIDDGAALAALPDGPGYLMQFVELCLRRRLVSEIPHDLRRRAAVSVPPRHRPPLDGASLDHGYGT